MDNLRGMARQPICLTNHLKVKEVSHRNQGSQPHGLCLTHINFFQVILPLFPINFVLNASKQE